MASKKEKEAPEEEIDAMTRLSDDELRKFREVFSSFDEVGSGSVTRADVAMGMRVVGLTPTEAEVTEICNKVSPGGGKFDFNGFCQCLFKQQNNPRSRDAMIRAFRVFDPRGLGVLTQAEFRHVFEVVGGEDAHLEPLIVDDLVDYADEAQGGQVKYEEFVKKLYDEYEEHQAKKAAEKAGKV